MGRRGISQSDGSDSWEKLSFSDKQEGQKTLSGFAESQQYLHSRMVGLFLCRIFLNFPLKSRGGNGSRGKLARRPRTASSSPSEHSVSLSAMSLTALSSEDTLDGGGPSAAPIILPCEASRLIHPISQQEYLNVSLPSFRTISRSNRRGKKMYLKKKKKSCRAEMQPELSASAC